VSGRVNYLNGCQSNSDVAHDVYNYSFAQVLIVFAQDRSPARRIDDACASRHANLHAFVAHL
jgi:hypothetical protein